MEDNMKTDLMAISKEKIELAAPLYAGIEKALSIFDEIKSFADIERLFLKGSGLSPNTYRSYLTSIRKFYIFMGGLNPLQVTPAHIENFYDDLIENGVSKSSAALRIWGLKKFFICIKKVVPIYISPFDNMEPKLVNKISKRSDGNRTKTTLTNLQVNLIKEFFNKKDNLYAKQNYAIFYMMITSGLRASELVQLRWCDIIETEKGTICYFTGKGDKKAEQELWPAALEACKMAYLWTHKNHPDMRSKDVLFWTVPTYSGDISRPLQYHALYERIRGMGEELLLENIITENIEFTPGLFRRSYATILYDGGMGIKAIQRKMRHKNINITAEYYIHDEENAEGYLKKLFTEAT